MQNRFLGRVIGQTAVLTIVNFIIAAYIIFRGKSFKLEYCKYALIISVPLIPHYLGASMLVTIDRIVINKFCGEAYTALYSVVYTCSMALNLLQFSINSAWNPWFFAQLNSENYTLVKKAYKPLVVVYCVIAYSVVLFAPEVVNIVGGKTYSETVVLMPPIMLGVVCYFMCFFYFSAQIYHKKSFGISIRTIATGLFSLTMNIIFVPIFGYAASAYITFASYLLLLILHWIAGKKLGTDNYFDSKFIFATTLVMTVLFAIALAVYPFRPIRFGLAGLFIVALAIVMWRHKASLLMLVNMFRNKEASLK